MATRITIAGVTVDLRVAVTIAGPVRVDVDGFVVDLSLRGTAGDTPAEAIADELVALASPVGVDQAAWAAEYQAWEAWVSMTSECGDLVRRPPRRPVSRSGGTMTSASRRGGVGA